VLDDWTGESDASDGSDVSEAKPVSKRAQKKAAKKVAASDEDSEDEAAKPVSKKDKQRLATKEAKKEEKAARKKEKAVEKAAKKAAKAAKKDAKAAKKVANEEEAAAEEAAVQEEPEREIPAVVDFFDKESGPNGTYYVDYETMGKLLDAIFFMYPFEVDIQAGFSPNGLPYKPGEFERVKVTGGEMDDVSDGKPKFPGDGATKEEMDNYNSKLNLWEGAPYVKPRIDHRFFKKDVSRSPWDMLIMIELGEPVKRAVKQFVIEHNMQERCPQLANMSDYRVGHAFPWKKFIQEEQMRIAGVSSSTRKYSIQLQQRFHDEIIVHAGVIKNRDADGKMIEEGDGTRRTIPWLTHVKKEGAKGLTQSYATHGRHMFDLSPRPNDLSADLHALAWNVEAMLGRIGKKRIEKMEQGAASASSSGGSKAKPAAKTTSKTPSVNSTKVDGKRNVDEVYEGEGTVIFSQPGIREAMCDPNFLFSVCYMDAEGQTVTHDIPTQKSFEFIVRKKARPSTVNSGVLQICG
jgi:hypothetical protein